MVQQAGDVMDEYVVIYDQEGWPIAEIEPSSAQRSWVLDDIGRARIEMPRNDPKLDSDLISYGNLVAIFSPNVFLWAGVILPPVRVGISKVTYTAYTGESLLRGRVIEELVRSKKGSAGALFRKVIRDVQRLYQHNLKVGDITESGESIDVAEHYRDSWDLVKWLVDETGEDFVFEPVIRKKKLWFLAHWYPMRGRNLATNVRLYEGLNVSSDWRVQESGEIFNEVIVIGKGDNWDKRPIVTKRDRKSVGYYGRRTKPLVESGISTREELRNIARDFLLNNAYPSQRFLLKTTNVDGLWSKFDVGDLVGVELVSYDFTPTNLPKTLMPARIIAREYSAAHGVMSIVAEAYYHEFEGIGQIRAAVSIGE